MLLRSVEPVTEIAEARDDELVGVQTGIDDRRKYMNVRMMLLHERDPLGRRDNANHADVAGA